jgi:hypothetical protein
MCAEASIATLHSPVLVIYVKKLNTHVLENRQNEKISGISHPNFEKCKDSKIFEDYCLLEWDTIESDMNIPLFQVNLQPPYSRGSNKYSQNSWIDMTCPTVK